MSTATTKDEEIEKVIAFSAFGIDKTIWSNRTAFPANFGALQDRPRSMATP
jgi:hypothetical protein